ncbi:MAG: OB-fold domain-containing protein [Roseovarius sp.]
MSILPLPAKDLPLWRCTGCDALASSPVSLCPACRSDCISEIRSPGNGTVAASTVIRRPSAAAVVEGPFGLCVVRLDEGVLVPGHLPSPETMPVGTPVRIVARRGAVPVFDLQESASA